MKRRKKSVQKEKEREKRREKGERRITNGWAQICAQREREGRKGEKRACKRKKKERKGEKRAKGGSLTGGRKYAPKGNGKDEKEKKERAKGKRRREKAERMIKSNPKEDEKRMKGGCTSANATERLRHTSPKTTRLFSTTRMFGANTRISAHLHNHLLFNALHQQAHLQSSTLHVPRCG